MLQGLNTVVVEEASAKQDVDSYFTHANADHFTVCKARHEADDTVIGKVARFKFNNLPANSGITSPLAESEDGLDVLK